LEIPLPVELDVAFFPLAGSICPGEAVIRHLLRSVPGPDPLQTLTLDPRFFGSLFIRNRHRRLVFGWFR
jgi:hypothetical protein